MRMFLQAANGRILNIGLNVTSVRDYSVGFLFAVDLLGLGYAMAAARFRML